MHNAGVVVYNLMMQKCQEDWIKKLQKSINVSEEEAWKFVTLNPAKLLHDDKVGSIKVGKDADMVLWNANPLSI
jgi:imidazolonepropionase-like amidohydrolase